MTILYFAIYSLHSISASGSSHESLLRSRAQIHGLQIDCMKANLSDTIETSKMGQMLGKHPEEKEKEKEATHRVISWKYCVTNEREGAVIPRDLGL